MNYYDYFAPKQHYSSLKGSRLINYRIRSRLLIDISLFVSIVVCSVFIYRYVSFGIESASSIALIAGPIILMSGLFYIKKTGNLNRQRYFLLVLLLIILPIRVYDTGGLLSPNFSWFFVGIVGTWALFSRKIFYSYLFVAAFQLIFIHILTPTDYFSPIGLRIFVHLSAFIVVGHILITISNVNKLRLTQSLELEKLKTINLMITSISHELNNPLAIAKGKIAQLIRKQESLDEKSLQKVNHSLDRITEVVKKIQEIEKEGHFETEQYSKDGPSMLSLK